LTAAEALTSKTRAVFPSFDAFMQLHRRIFVASSKSVLRMTSPISRNKVIYKAASPVTLRPYFLPLWVPMKLKKITVDEGCVKKEGPSYSLPRAATN
jgi:hypothetical protein